MALCFCGLPAVTEHPGLILIQVAAMLIIPGLLRARNRIEADMMVLVAVNLEEVFDFELGGICPFPTFILGLVVV
ncbi:hypothetical protein Tco_1501288 [Tanacetum coccineum]